MGEGLLLALGLRLLLRGGILLLLAVLVLASIFDYFDQIGQVALQLRHVDLRVVTADK